MYTFKAVIYKVGINPCVDIPEDLISKLQKTGFIPIRGTINKFVFLGNLVPVKNKPYRLFTNMIMLKGADANVGDEVTIAFDYDPKPRIELTPKALKEAFKENKQMEDIFESFSPSRKKEICRYLNNLKSDEAVQRNIEKLFKNKMKFYRI